MADNTTPKQRGGFAPGQSGNPAGPKARNKATVAVEALLAGEAQELSRNPKPLCLLGGGRSPNCRIGSRLPDAPHRKGKAIF